MIIFVVYCFWIISYRIRFTFISYFISSLVEKCFKVAKVSTILYWKVKYYVNKVACLFSNTDFMDTYDEN